MTNQILPLRVVLIVVCTVSLLVSSASADGNAGDAAWPALQKPLVDELLGYDAAIGEWLSTDRDRITVRVLPGLIRCGGLSLMPLAAWVADKDHVVVAVFETTSRQVVATVTLVAEPDSLVVSVRDTTGDGRADIEVAGSRVPASGRRITEQTVIDATPIGAAIVLRPVLRVVTRETQRSEPGTRLDIRARVAWVDTNGDGTREVRVRRDEVETTAGPEYRPLDWSRVITEELWTPDDAGIFVRRHVRVLDEPTPAEYVRLARHHERAGHFQRAGAAARRCLHRYEGRDPGDGQARHLSLARMLAHRYPPADGSADPEPASGG